MRYIPEKISRLLLRYYLGPDHPFKMRSWGAIFRAFGHPKLTKNFYGGKLALDLRDLVQREILVNGDYEPEVWGALKEHVRDGDVVYDIGAHVGSFSVKAASDPRVSKVLSFECCTPTLEQLRLNQKLNHNKFEVHPFAIGKCSGEMELSWGERANWGRASLTLTRDSEQTELVKIQSLDELVHSLGFPTPNLLKIDIEGSEKSALLGATQILGQPALRAIVFESAQYDKQLKDVSILDLLSANGFQVKFLPRKGDLEDEFGNFLAYR